MLDLRELDEVLGASKEWLQAQTVLRAVKAELLETEPRCLIDVRAEWDEPRFALTFVHEDGVALEVSDGDCYTAIVGGEVNYHGDIPESELIAVIKGALAGSLTYVRHARLDYKVADYFVVDSAGDQIGRGSYGISGFPGWILGTLPLLRESVSRTRIRFDHAPAFSTAP